MLHFVIGKYPYVGLFGAATPGICSRFSNLQRTAGWRGRLRCRALGLAASRSIDVVFFSALWFLLKRNVSLQQSPLICDSAVRMEGFARGAGSRSIRAGRAWMSGVGL